MDTSGWPEDLADTYTVLNEENESTFALPAGPADQAAFTVLAETDDALASGAWTLTGDDARAARLLLSWYQSTDDRLGPHSEPGKRVAVQTKALREATVQQGWFDFLRAENENPYLGRCALGTLNLSDTALADEALALMDRAVAAHDRLRRIAERVLHQEAS